MDVTAIGAIPSPKFYRLVNIPIPVPI